MAIAFSCILGAVIHLSPRWIFLPAVVLPMMLYVGAIAPRFAATFGFVSTKRMDFYQWKWGLVVWAIAFALIFALEPQQTASGALACTALLALYIAGKWGCYRAGCCGSMPYRVVNATASLPAIEARVTAMVLVLVSVCVLLGQSGPAMMIGLCGHLITRLFGYWCRGERLILTDVKRMPDIPALLAVLVLEIPG